MEYTHIPVLKKEVLEYLNPKPNENFIDATIGEGGHTIEILEKNEPEGKILGIDQDSQQIKNSRLRLASFEKNINLVNDSYDNLSEIVEKTNFKPVNGILLDLGMSSWQLEQSKRGFSFSKNEILDMRYSGSQELTGEKIVNEYPETEIERILTEFGEEKFARQIAKKITEQRKIKKIESTFELKDIIGKAIPARFHSGKIHFATRSFQAIRIAVNGELDNLTKFLPQAISVLASKGRLVIISFHSLEDRIVKNFFKDKSKEGIIKILTQKPVIASIEELLKNPRSRSAKLRAIIKI